MYSMKYRLLLDFFFLKGGGGRFKTTLEYRTHFSILGGCLGILVIYSWLIP